MHEHLDWHRVHDELSRLARTRAHLDWEEGTWLVRALRCGVHLRLGYASFAEYIERLFGYSPRWTEERIRVAEALEGLPALAQALRDGIISWSVARELTRVACAENEAAWLEVARGRTCRDVEELVTGHAPGHGPDDAAVPALRRHVLHMEVSAETFATFREAMGKLRRDAGESLDDDAALLLLARHVLGGPGDEGRSCYQVALTVCESCQRGWQQGRGEHLSVGAEIVEMARCDAQHVGRADREACTNVGATHSEEARPRRAHQDVPPAVRRRVLRRDGGRCVVPGCRHATFVDIHHVDFRSEGGEHDEDNLIVLCSAHHRALHLGRLQIQGHVGSGLIFRHADGRPYGTQVDPLSVGANEEAFRALRGLGFRDGEARSALEQARKRAHLGAKVEELIRAALEVLASPRMMMVTEPVKPYGDFPASRRILGRAHRVARCEALLG
jgi:hypothetical protein